MSGKDWAPGDRLKYLDKNKQWAYGTVTTIDGDKVYASLDGYPRGVKGCFRSQSPGVVKVKGKGKGVKHGRN